MTTAVAMDASTTSTATAATGAKTAPAKRTTSSSAGTAAALDTHDDTFAEHSGQPRKGAALTLDVVDWFYILL